MLLLIITYNNVLFYELLLQVGAHSPLQSIEQNSLNKPVWVHHVHLEYLKLEPLYLTLIQYRTSGWGGGGVKKTQTFSTTAYKVQFRLVSTFFGLYIKLVLSHFALHKLPRSPFSCWPGYQYSSLYVAVWKTKQKATCILPSLKIQLHLNFQLGSQHLFFFFFFF